LEGVQEGEQGGCWFIDQKGLVTGEPGRRIQLYQKIDYEYTIEDQDFTPINNFKPMCAVFVTDSADRWWFIWEWSEPSTRAICIEAELEFFYDSNDSLSNFFESNSPGRIYYADEESVQQGQKPQAVSAQFYLKNLIDIARMEGRLDDEEFNKIKERLKDILYDSSGGVLHKRSSSSYFDYLPVIRDIADQYVSINIWMSSMRIDNEDNAEDMGTQEWVNNLFRIRDSVGSCNKFACLKNVPKYVPDTQGWELRAQEELTEASQKLKNYFNNINGEKSEMDPDLMVDTTQYIDKIVELQFYLDTLIKAGYGESQLNENANLSSLSKFLDSIYKASLPLLKNNTSLVDVAQIKSIENLGRILHNMEILDEFLPDLPLESSGFGWPQKRTMALDMILDREHLRPQACLYREF